MPVYLYEAVDRMGKKVKGELASDSEQRALTSLKMQSLFPLKITESKKKEKNKSANKDLFKPKVNKKHVAIFARQFASMLKAGIPLTIILNVLIKQETNPTFKEILESINSDIMKGSTLSLAMAKFKEFPSIMVSMVEVGEANGRLDIAFGRVAINMEKEIRLASKVKGAMIYPVILLIVTIAASTLLTFIVLPKFTDMFKQMGAKLPVTTRIFVGFSSFMTKYWYIPLGVIIFILIISTIIMKNQSSRKTMDKIIFRLPLIGRVQNIILMARFCSTFSALIESGVSVIIAFETVRNVINNLFIKSKFDDIIRDVQSGDNISSAIEKYEMFTPLVVSMTRIGEESGQLGEILTNTALLYEEESEAQLQRLTAMAEPAITIFMAVIVGFIVISIVQPMFGIYNLIGK